MSTSPIPYSAAIAERTSHHRHLPRPRDRQDRRPGGGVPHPDRAAEGEAPGGHLPRRDQGPGPDGADEGLRGGVVGGGAGALGSQAAQVSVISSRGGHRAQGAGLFGQGRFARHQPKGVTTRSVAPSTSMHRPRARTRRSLAISWRRIDRLSCLAWIASERTFPLTVTVVATAIPRLRALQCRIAHSTIRCATSQRHQWSSRRIDRGGPMVVTRLPHAIYLDIKDASSSSADRRASRDPGRPWSRDRQARHPNLRSRTSYLPPPRAPHRPDLRRRHRQDRRARTGGGPRN